MAEDLDTVSPAAAPDTTGEEQNAAQVPTSPMVTWSPEEVNAYSLSGGVSGEDPQTRSPSETINALFNVTVDILSGNPAYKDIEPTGLMNLSSPYLLDIFPEANPQTPSGVAWRKNWLRESQEEKQRQILSRVTNLREAELEDYLKAGAKGLATGAAASEVGLLVGRQAFQAAPLYMPGPWSLNPATAPLGYLSKPFAGIFFGGTAAVGTAFLTDTVADEYFPENRGNLLPGEESGLEGARTAGGFLGGVRVPFSYRREAIGPALALQRYNRHSSLSENAQPAPRALRVAAFLDNLLPATGRLAREKPGRFVTSEALTGALAGYAVNKFQLDEDPATRAFVEMGVGFIPMYGMVGASQNLSNLGAKAYGVWSSYSPINPALAFSSTKRQELAANYQNLWNKVRSRTDDTLRPRPVDTTLLETPAGREAVQKLLDIFTKMGEDPAEVARRIEAGEDPLAELDPKTLALLRQYAPEAGVNLAEGEIAVTALPRGIIANSPTLMALESMFASQKDQTKASEALEKASAFQAALIKVFSLSGTPEGVEMARQIQKERYATFFADKFADVATRAVETALRVGGPYKPETGVAAEQALYNAMINQFRIVERIGQKLYEEAAPEVPPLSVFKNAKGEDLDLPAFIQRWDEMIASENPERLVALRGSPEFREIESAIDRYRGVLGLPGGVGQSPAQLRFETRLDKEAENSKARAFFDRIIAGEVEPQARPASVFDQRLTEAQSTVRNRFEELSRRYGVTDDTSPENLARLESVYNEAKRYSKFKTPREREQDAKVAALAELRRKELIASQSGEAVSAELPELQRNAAGELLPTEENVKALQTILQDFMPTQGRTKTVRDATELVRLQKEALQAALRDDTPTAIDVRDLVNFRRALVQHTEKFREKGDSLYGFFSQTLKSLDDDLDNSIDEALSARWSVARRYWKGYRDAQSRSTFGEPSQEKAFGEAKITPEEFARRLLRGGSDKIVAERYQTLWSITDGFRRESAQRYPGGIVAELDGEDVELVQALTRTTEDIEGWATEILGRDIIAPLEIATRRAKNSKGEESVPEAQRKALAEIKARLGADGMKNLAKVLGEDFATLLRNTEDASELLRRSKSILDKTEEARDANFALSVATNSNNPYEVVNLALNRGDPVKALDEIVTSIRDIGRKVRVAESGGQARRTAFGRFFPKGEKAAQALERFDEQEALQGLRGNLFDVVFQGAGGAENFDPARAYALLFSPGVNGALSKENKTSLANWMLSRNLVTREELNGYEQMLDTFSRISAGVLAGKLDFNDIDAMDTIFASMAIRFAGAKAGAMVGNLMPGGSTIQVPAMGVQVAQTFFEKLPAAANFNTLAKIVQDKELLTLALKTPRSPEEKEGLLKAFFRRAKKVFGEGWEEASGFASPRIAFALSRPVQIGPRIQAPYAGQAPQEEAVEEEPPPVAPGPDQRSMAPVPPAPTRVAAGPAPALGPRIPAAPPVPPTQSSGPVDRGRFLSLFPSGVAADVARSQQGIGSLM